MSKGKIINIWIRTGTIVLEKNNSFRFCKILQSNSLMYFVSNTVDELIKHLSSVLSVLFIVIVGFFLIKLFLCSKMLYCIIYCTITIRKTDII